MKQEQDSQFKFQGENKRYGQQFMQQKGHIQLDIAFICVSIFTKLTPIFFFFILSEYKILDFTLVLLLSSLDFWLTKNIVGRKLVGMVWWMKINESTGEQTWIFHSMDNEEIHGVNYNVFWSCCLIGAVFWGFSTLLSLLISRLFWISLCAVCFLLSSINLLFYLRCRGNHQDKIKGLADRIGLQSAHALVGEY